LVWFQAKKNMTDIGELHAAVKGAEGERGQIVGRIARPGRIAKVDSLWQEDVIDVSVAATMGCRRRMHNPDEVIISQGFENRIAYRAAKPNAISVLGSCTYVLIDGLDKCALLKIR
jgi:hypothetical protein